MVFKSRKYKLNRVNSFLEDIVNKKFDNAEQARIWYANNIFDQEKKIRGIENKTTHNIDMINLYDSVNKFFVAPNYNKSDDEQPDTTDTCLNWKVKNLLHKEENMKEKELEY